MLDKRPLNMRYRVYIETSVVSYLTSRQSVDAMVAGHQAATCEMWRLLGGVLEPHVSDLVRLEAARGDAAQSGLRVRALQGIPTLETTGEVEKLAQDMLDEGAIPPKCPEDALHIALAAAHGMDMLVTWNFRHINNPAMKQSIRAVVQRAGYAMPEICSPDEIVGGLT